MYQYYSKYKFINLYNQKENPYLHFFALSLLQASPFPG